MHDRIGRCRWALALLLLLSGCEQPPPALFVSMPVQDAVLRVDPASGEILSKTIVGRLPHHLVVDEARRRVYVSLTGSQAVAELDADSGALLRTLLTAPVPVTRPDGSRIDGHRDQDAFAHSSCYDCHRGGEGGVKPVITGVRPFALALEGRTLYVSNTRGGDIARLPLDGGSLPALAVPAAGPAVEPSSLALRDGRLYLSVLAPQPADNPAVLRAMAVDDGRILAEATTGPRANFLLADPHRGQVYVANFETNTVSVFGTDGGPRGRYTVGPGPQGLALTPDGRRLLVANYYGTTLSLVELDSGEVRTFPLTLDGQSYSNPSHLVVADDGRSALVVTSGTKGWLLRVDLDARAVRQASYLGPLPFDLAVVRPPVSHQRDPE